MKKENPFKKHLNIHFHKFSAPVLIFTPRFRYLASTTIVAATGIVFAFAWKDFWSEVFAHIRPYFQNTILFQLSYALFISALMALILFFVAHWAKRNP